MMATLVFTGGNGSPIDDGVDQPTARASQTFPSVAPPSPDPLAPPSPSCCRTSSPTERRCLDRRRPSTRHSERRDNPGSVPGHGGEEVLMIAEMGPPTTAGVIV